MTPEASTRELFSAGSGSGDFTGPEASAFARALTPDGVGAGLTAPCVDGALAERVGLGGGAACGARDAEGIGHPVTVEPPSGARRGAAGGGCWPGRGTTAPWESRPAAGRGTGVVVASDGGAETSGGGATTV